MVVMTLLAATAGVTAASVQASPRAVHGRAETCQQDAATKHYFHADTARVARRVHVVGELAKLNCGGPDDLNYAVTSQVQHLVLRRDAVVKVLKQEPTGLVDRRINQRRLPRWLRHDHNVKIFRVTGPNRHVRRLVEMFHP
jgi:hypothetical protein